MAAPPDRPTSGGGYFVLILFELQTRARQT